MRSFAIYIFILLFFIIIILLMNKQLGCLAAGDEVVIVYWGILRQHSVVSMVCCAHFLNLVSASWLLAKILRPVKKKRWIILKNIFFFIILGQETGANPYGESREGKSKFRGIFCSVLSLSILWRENKCETSIRKRFRCSVLLTTCS